jgi:hypothetical protein
LPNTTAQAAVCGLSALHVSGPIEGSVAVSV